MAFNNGKPYHGSAAIAEGRLTGATDASDYFYFFCPRCGDRHIMRVLEHGFHQGPEPAQAYPDVRPRQTHDVTVVLKLHCSRCDLTDFVKISNTGWQGGRLPEESSA